VVSVGLVVPGAFDRLIYGRLAVAGSGGVTAALRLAKRYMIYSFTVSAATSLVIFVSAGAIPWLAGADYSEAVGLAQVLCWTVVSTSLQFLAYDALNAAELHRLSTAISGITNVAGAALLLWLGSAYGVVGVFVALYLSDIVRAAAMWLALLVASRRNEIYHAA
jgi:O-antigen/teichoic acid export membrane protein